jgi:hypothetical protein
MSEDMNRSSRPYKIVGHNYVSLYIEDFDQALKFYEQAFGRPESVDEESKIFGWRFLLLMRWMSSTKL